MRRVVVTGLGLVTPLGNDVKSSWEALIAGKSGIGPITRFDAKDFGSQVAGEVKNFDPAAVLPPKEARRFDLFVPYGVAAGKEALADAGLDFLEKDAAEANRAGCVLGSGIGGLDLLCKNYATYLERGPRRFSPFLIPGAISNMAAGELSILTHLRGPNFAPVSACATGLHSIGEAMWVIRRGDADVMVAGGTESTICPDAVGGFDMMHALSRLNDDPARASRPFDVTRGGFVLGEGAGLVVLEDYDHAVKRGAHIYCEIVGYGLSADGFHITTPSTDGPSRCMQMALDHAGLKPADIDYLNCHGTATHVGDINESKAVRQVFGDATDQLAVSSTKGATGHLLGAAGTVEAVFTILAIRDQVAPPTINLTEKDPEVVVNVVANEAKKMPINYAMKNNFGFGGTNATLIFKKL